MKTLLILALVGISAVTDARLTIRHRRQVEREGSSSEGSDLPASEVVVIKDTVNPTLPGPLFLVPRLPGPGDAFDLDINERDGTFTFGGMLPSHMHHHHAVQHQSFAGLFDAIQRRFDEMTRNMMSFNNFGPGFNPTTDISSLPDDYNKTDSEIVEMGGHRYVKKTTTLKKGSPGASFFVRSTTFERVNENDNADVPPSGSEEEAKKADKPEVEEPVKEQPEPGSSVSPSASTPDAKDVAPVDAPVSDSSPAESPKNGEEDSSSSSGYTPDIVSSSSESAPSANDESPAAGSESTDDREREGDSLPASSSTEQSA